MNFLLIWLEALTPKQALLMSKIAKLLIDSGFDILVTTRKYDYTVGIFNIHNVPAHIIGEYGGGSLEGKLRSSLERQIKLLNIVGVYKPDVHVSFTSPESTRVAFGLKIPIVLLTDTPHSTPVNKLTIPLAEAVITPICTRNSWLKLGYNVDYFKFFDGIFEVAWILGFKPNKVVLANMNLKEYEYVIVRPEEKKASYYMSYANRYSEPTFFTAILDYVINELNLKVVFFPRYRDQLVFVKDRYGDSVLIPKESVDLQSLEAYARAIVTGGSTIAVEGALQGVPSVTLFPRRIETVDYLKKLGFPIFHIPVFSMDFRQVLNIVENAEQYRRNVHEILKNLENPLPLIIDEISRYKR